MTAALIVPTLLQNLRDCCALAYTSEPAALRPTEFSIHHDGPAATIDAPNRLVVFPTSLDTAFVGAVEQCAYVLQVGMAVAVTRSTANLTEDGQIATSAHIEPPSLQLARDGSLLWYALHEACRAGTLWHSFLDLDCRDTTFGSARPTVGGQIGVWTLPLSVKVTAPLLVGS